MDLLNSILDNLANNTMSHFIFLELRRLLIKNSPAL